MSDFILTNLPCSGRILIVADAVTEQAVCTSGSVVEYRLAKARVAGSNPVSRFFIGWNFLDLQGISAFCVVIVFYHGPESCSNEGFRFF